MTEKIIFYNSKGLKLVGVLHRADKSLGKVVIMAHGFTSNKDRPRFIKLAETLADENINAFRFDFGGSGESGDTEITIEGFRDDLQSAKRIMKERKYLHTGIFGASLGGIIAFQIFDPEVQAMAFWAPNTKGAKRILELTDQQKEQLKQLGYYTKYKDNRIFKISETYLQDRKNINREELLGRITIPVLIIHGSDDQLVPLEDSREAIKLLPKGSQLLIIENGDHTLKEYTDIIIPKTVSWFKSFLK